VNVINCVLVVVLEARLRNLTSGPTLAAAKSSREGLDLVRLTFLSSSPETLALNCIIIIPPVMIHTYTYIIIPPPGIVQRWCFTTDLLLGVCACTSSINNTRTLDSQAERQPPYPGRKIRAGLLVNTISVNLDIKENPQDTRMLSVI